MTATLAAWRGITRRQLVLAMRYAAAVMAMHFVLYSPAWTLDAWRAGPTGERGVVDLAVALAITDAAGAFMLLLALAVAERAAADPRRRIPYVAAVVIAAGFWATLFWIATEVLHFRLGLPRELVGTPTLWRTYTGFFEWLMLNGAATLGYLHAERARSAQARMEAAQAERNDAARRMLESQLQAMQARVEPAFLFDTLREAHAMYERDFAQAESVLENLVAYLQAAMPQMRTTTSTVTQEFALARAYLAIAKVRLRGRLDFEVRLAPDVARARMPPMMLLPLIDRALARHPRIAATGGALQVSCVGIGGAHLRIDVVDSGPDGTGCVEDARVISMRERLAALYSAGARLTVACREGHAGYATLDLPRDDMDAEAGPCVTAAALQSA